MACPGHPRARFISSTVHFVSDTLRRSACATATDEKSADSNQGEGNKEMFHGGGNPTKIHPGFKFHHTIPESQEPRDGHMISTTRTARAWVDFI
jgi:hypothetical protein